MGPEALEQLFINGERHGNKSAGVAYVDSSGEVRTVKEAVSPERFVKDGFLTDASNLADSAWNSTLGIGHTRAPTHGEVCARNAHPFEHQGYVYAHNGIVVNYKELGNTEVDSQVLGPLIKDRKLSMALGSVGLVWITPDRKLRCYRTGQGLAAHVYEFSGGDWLVIVASRDYIIPSFIKESAVRMSTPDLVPGVEYEVARTGVYAVHNHLSSGYEAPRTTAVVRQYASHLDRELES